MHVPLSLDLFPQQFQEEARTHETEVQKVHLVPCELTRVPKDS